MLNANDCSECRLIEGIALPDGTGQLKGFECRRIADEHLLYRHFCAEIDRSQGVLRLQVRQCARDHKDQSVCNRQFRDSCRGNGIGPLHIASGAVTSHIDARDAARQWLEIAPSVVVARAPLNKWRAIFAASHEIECMVRRYGDFRWRRRSGIGTQVARRQGRAAFSTRVRVQPAENTVFDRKSGLAVPIWSHIFQVVARIRPRRNCECARYRSVHPQGDHREGSQHHSGRLL
jgi:hypothetical protein